MLGRISFYGGFIMVRRKLFFLLAVLGLIILGAISFIIVGGGVRSSPGEAQPESAGYPEYSIPTTGVIVALQPIPRGGEFVAGSIGPREWPAENTPPDIIANETETIGKIARDEIVQGQVIVRSMLLEKGGEGAASLQFYSPSPEQISLDNTFNYEITAASYAAQAKERRVIIYTGYTALVVKDTQEAIAAITNLAEKMEGYVSESNTYQTSNNVLQGTITIRVSSEHYQETLAALRSLALRVEREESRSQDVTEEFIDQKARAENLKAGETAMQKLLDGRQTVAEISDIAEIQQKLAEIRGQIEQTEGRLRYLIDQAYLSTINIELIPETSPPTPTPTPTPLPGWSPQSVATDASQSLMVTLQNTVNVVIWGIIFWLPVVVIYLLPLMAVVWFIRWVRKRQRTVKSNLNS